MAKRKKIKEEDDYKEDKTDKSDDGDDGDDSVNCYVKWMLSCREEAKLAKWNRTEQTRTNWDVYHMRQDFSHKLPGQSREVLSMQPMAVEQTAAFFQQALADMGEAWWSCDARHPQNEAQMKVTTDMVKAVTQMQIDKASFLKHVSNGIKSGLLGAKIITKVHGDKYAIPKYVAVRKKTKREAELQQSIQWAWKLRLDIVSQYNYYPDPTPTNHRPLYEIEDMYMDYADLVKLSEGEDAIYDPDVVELVEKNMPDESEEQSDQSRRTNQNEAPNGYRGRVKITEYWGNVIGDDGKMEYENIVMTMANDRWLIRPPTENPLWHQGSPYVTGDLLDIPDAVWPKALMDAPSRHNIAATELYNLLVDGGMKAVNNIGMIRQDWLEDPNQVEGGIKPGTNLNVNSQCPPGAKALEMVQTGTVPPDAQNVYNIINQEFNRAALTSDIRQGMQPKGDASATQVVETNQTITSVFSGMSKNIEQVWMQNILEKAWMTCAQYSDLMDEDELTAVLGPDDSAKYLDLTPAERFAETVHGVKFRVNGITLTLQKAQDARRYMTLLQTIGANEVLMEEYVKAGYSMGQLLIHIMRSMGIDVRALEMSQTDKEVMQQQAAAPPAAPGGGANQMSQVTSPTTGSQQDQLGSAAPAPLPTQGMAQGKQ